ncbi:TRNA (adenine(58)-N(1))-methyltransferase [Aphelenchoides bicaudatus]|nr:TRNA (adenine(58)-N(1))-methyltransferase [Aphelenchoides bicaudatus]
MTNDTQMVTGQTFLHNEEYIREGDVVIIYVDSENILSVVVKLGTTCNMKNGALRHEFLIGKRYGTRLSATGGPIYALRPNPPLWMKVLKRRTQILYTPEVAMIISLLDLKPGDAVCESGTGSGSLTHSLATTVGASGHVYTYDIEEPQFEKIKAEIEQHGLQACVTPHLRNVCLDGFQVERKCHAVFLDLPAPWLAVTHAMQVFDRSKICRLVSFSPCIEQSQELCEKLNEFDFFNIKTVELVTTTYRSEKSKVLTLEELEMNRSERKVAAKRRAREDQNGNPENDEPVDLSPTLDEPKHRLLTPFPYQQPTHAGYLTSATLFPIE